MPRQSPRIGARSLPATTVPDAGGRAVTTGQRLLAGALWTYGGQIGATVLQFAYAKKHQKRKKNANFFFCAIIKIATKICVELKFILKIQT